jgi:hypothetical protein
MRRNGDTTYVLCRSAQRIDKDRAIRTKQEGRLLVDLEKLGRRVGAGQIKRAEKIAEAVGRLLRIPDPVINPIHRWTDSPASD